MADSSSNPAAVLGDAARFGDVRRRLFFLIGGLIVYRIGTYIPVPGIDPERVASFFRDNAQTIFGIVNAFSGGALQRMSIFTIFSMPGTCIPSPFPIHCNGRCEVSAACATPGAADSLSRTAS